MGSTILSNLDAFYGTSVGQTIAREATYYLKKTLNLQNDNVLAIGFAGSYLDYLDNEKLYYAIPRFYESIINWPKIRPFKTVVIDELHTPFLPETWDTVIVIHFLEHYGKKAEFLGEISRILKTNGKIIIVAVNEYSILYKSSQRKKFRKNTMDTKKLINDLICSSFHITNILGMNRKIKSWPYVFDYNFNKYSEIFISVFPFLSDVVIITAEKIETSASIIETLDPKYEI
jgi:SAM-dependent methyltransferase